MRAKILEKIIVIGLGILGEINPSHTFNLLSETSRRIHQPYINSPLIQTAISQKMDSLEEEMFRNGLPSHSSAMRYWDYLKKLVSSSQPIVRSMTYRAFLVLPSRLRQELIPLTIAQLFSEISSSDYFLETLALLGQEFSTERIAKFLLSQLKSPQLTETMKFASADALALLAEKMFPYLIAEIEGEAGENPDFQEKFVYLVGQMNIKNPQDPNWRKITQKIQELLSAPVRYQSNTDIAIKSFAINSILNFAQQDIDFVKNNFDHDALYPSLIMLPQRYPSQIWLGDSSLRALTTIYGDSDGEQIKKFLLFVISQSQFSQETKRVAYYCLGELGIFDEEVWGIFQNINQVTNPELRREMAVAFYKLTYGKKEFSDYLFLMLKEKDFPIRVQGVKGYTEIGLWMKRKNISSQGIQNLVIDFSLMEKSPEVQEEIAEFLGKVSSGDNLKALKILVDYTHSSSAEVLNKSIIALGRLKSRELFVLDRLREIATYRQALVFPIDSIASACHALGEIGIADFISLGILYREIENTQNSRILRASTEAIVKLLSLVLEKELSPYVRP